MRQSGVALYGVFTMSRLLELIGVVAFGAGVCLMFVSTARAQEARLPTIADCPPGYVLGVQDLAEPLLPARPTDPDGYPLSNQDANAEAQAEAAAPRRFVTGCVPPQPIQRPAPAPESTGGEYVQ